MDLTQRFSALDHTWDEEKATLEAGKAEASSRTDGFEASTSKGLHSFRFEHGVWARGR